MENSCKWHRTAIVVVCIVSATLAIVSCVFYNSAEALNNPRLDDSSHNVTERRENTTQMIEKRMKKQVIYKPMFPHCVREHIYTVFAGILQEFHVKQTMCTDSDCQRHNLNNNEDAEMTDDEAKDSSGLFVVYVVISLLLVSLIAAFLEVYRARKTPGRAARDKPELSRRCSLADLTVLRHNRRETMMRRDSVMHMSFDSATTSSNHHRVPLKLLGRMQSRPRLRVE